MLKKTLLILVIAVVWQCMLQGTTAEAPANNTEQDQFVTAARVDHEFEADEAFHEDDREELYQRLPEVLEYIKQLDTEFYTILTKDGDIRDDYEEEMLEFARSMLQQKEKEYPELEMELKHMVHDFHFHILVRHYHNTENMTQKQQCRKDMKGVLSKLFDIKIKMRETRIKLLQEELNELKAEVEHAKANKAGQVEAFLAKVTTSLTIFEQ